MTVREAPLEGAWSVLKRGFAASPAIRKGAVYTVVLAIVGATGSLLVPVLTQQVLDRGLQGPEGFRPRFVYGMCAAGAVAIVAVYAAARAAHARMVEASEAALKQLRVSTFAHIHRLSIAEQTSVRRGTFVSRVTSDVDQLTQFMEWGGIVWITATTLVVSSTVTMFVYSWRLALLVLLIVSPIVWVLRKLQEGLLGSYDEVRTKVGETLSEIAESVMGAAVIRAYGIDEHIDRRLKGAIDRQYRAQIHANRYQAVIFPTSDLFGALGLAAVIAVGAWMGPEWGLTSGRLIAFLFLVGLFLQPLAELSETFDQTQTAIAAWRKILMVQDLPIDLVEPIDGRSLPPGALGIDVEEVEFAYRDGGLVLRGIDATIEPGAQIAIVGETGCGKTTFAKLLCRLADPTSGRILIGGIDLRDVAPESRRRSIRMVPQDGFLFDDTIERNVAYGRPGAGRAEVEATIEELGLGGWLESLLNGPATVVGQRGENLSVGERQFVALARAQLADPGILILDEATSSVDPETERMLAGVLMRVAKGRTTITIAHRLSTAERADVVLVFDRGRIVQRGEHRALLAEGGTYAALYESWLGNVGFTTGGSNDGRGSRSARDTAPT